MTDNERALVIVKTVEHFLFPRFDSAEQFAGEVGLISGNVSVLSRIRVDVDHYRAAQEYRVIEEAERVADRVANSGRPEKLPPMNAYFRRLIHHHFKDHPKVSTWSPSDSAKIKRITMQPR